MISRLRKSWHLSLCLCGASLVLTLLYLGNYNVFAQIPPTYGYGYGYGYTPTVQFSSSSYSTAEGSQVQINVTLSAPTDEMVFVDYATSDGTGQSGVDYEPTSGMLVFQVGATQQQFYVSTLNDSNNTSYVTVNLSLSLPTYSNATLGQPSTAVLYVYNPSACPNQ